MTQNQLANLLRPFGIAPKTIRLDDPAMRAGLAHATTAKGYMREAFEAAWDRYLSPAAPVQSVTTSQASQSAAASNSQTVTSNSSVTDRNSAEAQQLCGL